MADFLADFETLLASSQATLADWRDLSADLQPAFFSAVVARTERDDPAVYPSLSLGIKTFALTRADFRDFLCDYAADADRLPPNRLTPQSRLILSALVRVSLNLAGVAAPELLRGLAANRGIDTFDVDLGDQVRTALLRQFDAVAALPPAAFIGPFSYILCVAQKPPELRLSSALDDRTFLLQVLHKLTEPATAELIWEPNTPFATQPLTILLEALAYVTNDPYPYDVNGQTEKQDAGDSLLRGMEQIVRLWSDAYTPWSPNPGESREDPFRCWQVETFLRALLERLTQVTLPNGAQKGYFEQGAVDRYQEWITLCGGFAETRGTDGKIATDPPQEIPLVVPYFLRNWREAARAAEPNALDSLLGVAVRRYIRGLNPLREPDDDSPIFSRKFTDISTLGDVAQESLDTATAQSLLPQFDLESGDLPDFLPGAPPTPRPFLLPRETIGRAQRDTALHPDHRRALRIAVASALQWRAEIAYRTAGPRQLASGFAPSQLRDLNRARRLYGAALDQTGGSAENPTDQFLVGMGLVGHAMDRDRAGIREECLLRLKQMDAQEDWAADGGQWPIRYVWEINDQITGLISRIKALENSSIDTDFKQKYLDADEEQARISVGQAQSLAQAAKDFKDAEVETQNALQREVNIAEVRVQIAKLRQQEASYFVAAHRFAADAAGDMQSAEEALLKVQEETQRQLVGQLKLLADNISALKTELPKLRQQIEEAEQTLPGFEKKARDQHEAKQSQSGIFSILKKIASLVSIYFTGVDLVAVAETAIQAVKSAQSGDWAGAILHARDAADLATKGKFSEALNQGIATAERVVGSVMSDSLDGAVSFLEDKFQIPRTEALTGAIDAVSRQAFRLGVSFLAKAANVQMLPAALGIPEPNVNVIARLRIAAESELSDAAWNAFQKQGQDVVIALKDAATLPLAPGGVEQRFRKAITDLANTGGDAEGFVVKCISDVQSTLSQDENAKKILAEFKSELLIARDRMAEIAQRELAADKETVKSALDRLTQQALEATDPQNLPLPPVVLPIDVVKTIQDFRSKTEIVRGKIGFLTEPEYADKAANQLSDIDDDQKFNDQLGKTMSQLRDGISDAKAAIGEAENDLVVLETKFGEGQVDNYKNAFRTEAEKWTAKAKQNLAGQEQQLLAAAGENALAADAQVNIENFASEVAASRLASQIKRVSAYNSQAKAADDEIQIRQIAYQRAQTQGRHWELLHGRPNPDIRENGLIAHQYYLDRANSLLIQSWQLFLLYDAQLSKLPAEADFKPTFLDPTIDSITVGQNLLKGAQDQWNQDLLESPRLITTIDLNVALPALSATEKQRLEPVLASFQGETLDGLKLTASTFPPEENLAQRLRRGVTFRIAPLIDGDRPIPTDYPEAPITVYRTVNALGQATPGLRANENTLTLLIDDTSLAVQKVRLLGVAVKFRADLVPPRKLQLRLRQEDFCGIIVREPLGGRRYVPLPIRPLHGENDNLAGVRLSPGTLNTRQWETRPLFGLYTLQLMTEPDDFVTEDTFEVEVDFIAVGQAN